MHNGFTNSRVTELLYGTVYLRRDHRIGCHVFDNVTGSHHIFVLNISLHKQSRVPMEYARFFNEWN